MESTLGKYALKNIEVTTMDAEYYIYYTKLGDKLERIFTGVNLYQICMPQIYDSWKEASISLPNSLSCLKKLPQPLQPFSTNHPEQSAAIIIKTRPSISKKITTI